MKLRVLAATAALLAFPVAASARALFTPNDPLAPKQYYLAQDHAFDAFDDLPVLNPVRVAIIDSGLDTSHPEFPAKKIWPGGARSFVSTDWNKDEQGHGTFVAGEIAAAVNNGQGIAGIAFPAQLIIAKIAGPDGTIAVHDEAAAIRWAVDRGARVINLSFGGTRDPHNPANDTYSAEEAAAIEYAVRHRALVVAATGNSDSAPATPWNWADYPAALPHVVGVSALTQSGDVPSFSNRDPIYDDIAAPGKDILSTVPLALTHQRPTCSDQGYSDCAPNDLRSGAGTSFATPQVSAAAAILFALRPTLRPDQVSNILERTANDLNSTDGCTECPVGRDQFSGWGRLDIAKAVQALEQPLPPPDRYEPNDDAGVHAPVIPAALHVVKATLDFWDDQVDVYKVRLARGQRVRLNLQGPTGTTTNLLLWKPGTTSVNDFRQQGRRVAQSLRGGASHKLVYRAKTTGWYYVEAKLTTRGFGPYTLSIARK